MEALRKSVKSVPVIETTSSSSGYSDDDFKDLPPSKCIPTASCSSTVFSSVWGKKLSCDKCAYKTQKMSNMKKHMRSHEKESKPARKTFSCSPCKYTTTKSSSWVKHEHSKKHQQLSGTINTFEGSFACPELNCRFSGTHLQCLHLHLEKDHSKLFETEDLTFENFEAFKVWKDELQVRDCVQFCKYRGAKGGSAVYHCHRSGLFIPKGNDVRELKKRGSVKCGRICLARLVVKNSETGCSVEYWKTHIGHTIDPGRVGIPSPAKRALAASIKDGVPKHKILQNLQHAHSNVITPMSLITNQDLVNIAKKFGVSSDYILHQNDAESIHRKYMQLKTSGDTSIFFYKPYSEVSETYPTLRTDEFVMAYMNHGQEHMLSTQGREIICIDSTHGTNAYNFEMTTLMTIDDDFQGFPVAFFFHSSKSQETYISFLTALKRRVGTITTAIFMSDDEPAFYNAWKAVMGNADRKLLCSWHVLRNWNKKLTTLDRDTRFTLGCKLRAVLYELNSQDFETAFNNLLTDILQNPPTSKLHSYFSSYWNRKEEWAYCYRNHAGINTNMRLERMHLEIKQKYLKGKKVKRLDVGFNGVLEYLKQRQYDRIVSDYRGKVSTKDHLLRAAHKRSFSGNFDHITTLDNSYIVQSFTDSTSFYSVTKVVSDCCCETRCFKCSACIHSFICTCIENSIRSNMCKHIHLVCRFVQQSLEVAENSDEDGTDLVVDTNEFAERRQVEIESHLVDLRSAQASFTNTCTQDSCKAAYEKVESMALDSDDYKIIQESLFQAMETIKAKQSAMECFPIRPEDRSKPGNTNAEKQHRYFPKKKPNKTSHSTISATERSDVMKTLLPLRMYTAPFEEDAVKSQSNLVEPVYLSSDDVPIGEEIVIDNSV